MIPAPASLSPRQARRGAAGQVRLRLLGGDKKARIALAPGIRREAAEGGLCLATAPAWRFLSSLCPAAGQREPPPPYGGGAAEALTRRDPCFLSDALRPFLAHARTPEQEVIERLGPYE